MPRDAPIRFWRGANDPAVVWRFKRRDEAPADLSGSRFDLEVTWPAASSGGLGPAAPAGAIRHASTTDDGGDGVLTVDLTSGSVAWPYTVEESETIPRGRGAVYTLFRTIAGRRRPWAGGSVTILGYGS